MSGTYNPDRDVCVCPSVYTLTFQVIFYAFLHQNYICISLAFSMWVTCRLRRNPLTLITLTIPGDGIKHDSPCGFTDTVQSITNDHILLIFSHCLIFVSVFQVAFSQEISVPKFCMLSCFIPLNCRPYTA
jgi:hypothetical protein